MNKKIMNRGLAFVFWMGIWILVARMINESLYFPNPAQTIRALRKLIVEEKFFFSVLNTVSRVFIGLLIANISGIILGLLCGFNQIFDELIRPFMTFVRSTPVMSLIIIALIWFKSSHVPIFISFLMCFPIIWMNIVEGFKKVDKKLLEMATVYNVSSYQKIKDIYIPSLIPFYIAGFNTALGIAWKVTVAAEVLSHPRFAIGTQLHDAKVYLNTPELFAWTLVIVILSYFFEILITNFIKKAMVKYY